MLWLDSAEYELWAKSKLLDKTGEVKKLGLKATKLLSEKHSAYLWWFWDTDDGDPACCPNCAGPLDPDTKFGFGKCEPCKIYI